MGERDDVSAAHATQPRSDAAALFRAHAGLVARVLHRAGVARRDVDDLVQEVFLVAHDKGGFVEGDAKATTWLARIALGLAANYRRKGRAEPAAPEAAERLASGDAADASTAVERASAALWSMDEGRRLVFVLYELEGVSGEDIAAALSIPVGTVYSRLSAARKAFVAALQPEGD